MKGNLVNSKWFLSIIVASLLMPLSSCSERRESLSSNTRQSFDITYSKKEIVIESSTKTGKDHFFKKDGEYFSSSDSILFFSVVRDTILNATSGGIDYKTIIKKEENGQFTTSNYLVSNTGCLFFLISYSYDSDYHISKIVKCANVVYQ